MRPLAIEPIANMPEFILGVALIRGEAVPVVELGRFLSGVSVKRVTRFVTLHVGKRRVAMAVAGVEGLLELTEQQVQQLPPLWESAEGNAIEGFAIRDHQLVEVLGSARLVPDAVWTQLDDVGA